MTVKQRREIKETETQETAALKHYLNQYYRDICRKNIFENRLRRINEDMLDPIRGQSFDAVNVQGGGESLGSAAYTIRKAECESAIEEARRKAAADMLKVMDILDFLGPSSDERTVLEMRYIDLLSWEDIQRAAHMSRSSMFDKQRSGLQILMGFKYVREKVTEFSQEFSA